MLYLLALIFFIAFAVIGMGSFVMAFINLPSMLIVLPPSFILAWGVTSNRALKLGVTLPFRKKSGFTSDEVNEACLFLRVFGWSALLMGAVGTLIGAVIMLQHLEDPSAIGPALAITILTLFYSLFLKIIMYSAEQKLIYQYNLYR